MKRKSKEKKKYAYKFILFFIAICILGITTFLYTNNTERKLSKLGYSKDETTIITEKLNSSSISEILKNEYNSNIDDFISHKDFKEEKLFTYVNELNKSELSIDNTIFIVNHKDYNDKIKYTEKIISIIKEKYYISENLNRYISYNEKNSEMESKEIVTLINSNRDYEYYTNTKKTNTDDFYKVIVNKYYYLDENFTPPSLVYQSIRYGRSDVQLEAKAYEQYKKMFEAAKKENLTLYLNSAYRSYKSQKEVYKEYEIKEGKNASNYAALPGYSEHQTGLALDIFKPGATTKTFEKTNEFKWLQENAHKFGFILRYPKGKENITGYSYESWHYRYVGEEIATYIYKNKITYEEYYAYYLK